MANAPWQAICGDWLSHPSGRDTPLNADLESMAAGLVRGDAYFSLILVPDSYRGASPNAFIARRDGDRVVVEPASIDEGYSWQ